jgi:hypothetical protein
MSCEKDDPTVIDPTLSFPRILSAYVTPNSFDTTSLNSVIGATVSSDLPVSNVTARVLNPDNVLLATIELKDDGVAPDDTAGDGKYTARMNFTLDCKLVGSYKIEISAINSAGLSSNLFNVGFNVTNTNNHPPILTNVISPDSLRRPSGINGDSVEISFLKAFPTDPDGICDVSQVYFHSFKPDGTPTNQGNAIPLYDDGTNCDTIPGDGKFSLCIKIVNNPLDPHYNEPPLGNYKFKYNALDRGNLVSDTLIKFIFVHP